MELESGEKQNCSGKVYSCKTCGKSFPAKSKLIIHERVHTGEKPYNCDKCAMTFARKDKLIVHQRVHTCEKPYHCGLFEKSFARKDTLTEHQRLHTGKKPYQCDNCEKAFAQKHTLTEHQRVHTGEKPYHCDICKKAYCAKSNLTKHKKLHFVSKKNTGSNLSLKQDNYVYCSESIKVETIKEEVIEKNGVEDPLNDPLSLQQNEDIYNCELNDSVTSDSRNTMDKREDNIFNKDNSDENNAHKVNILLDNVEVNNIDEEVNDVVDNIEVEEKETENSNLCKNLVDSDRIDIEEFKIEPGNFNMDNNTMEEVLDVVDNIEENINEVEENVVGQGNINYQVLENLSVAEALAFFSS